MDYVVLAIAQVLGFVLTAYMWIVIISALITWVNPDPYNPIVRFLRGITEPVFYKIRRTLPFVFVGGIDLSPLVVILVIQVLKIVVVGNLMRLAYSMGGASVL
ncbi:YggT family protein [Pseudodesulfovibrio senegalensis]|jgi:YggT family protein|uniref:YggT family protein n=1 Tax=Pseudodesulfovibrio senegalensis TaxID=1721087 RepID=A0A6N6N0E2_9BACT|nr:YggT family protein [Pseudodesulfovibrio senegalensis]KAB1441177.1 YggT family protein [Pseudodesulfovibrio senegalensis]